MKITFELRGRLVMRAAGATVTSRGAARTGSMTSAQALAFAARRLLADPVALLFATRDPGGEFTGLPELLVQGLEDTDARALLGSYLSVLLDEQVFDRILAEMRGNPLALLELPRGFTPEELAGGFAVLGCAGAAGPDRAELRAAMRGSPASGQAAAAGSSGGADG